MTRHKDDRAVEGRPTLLRVPGRHRLATRLALAVVGPVLLTAALVSLLIHQAIPQAVIPGALAELSASAALLVEDITAELDFSHGDVQSWRLAPDVRGLAEAIGEGRSPGGALLGPVAAHFRAEIEAKQSYLQIRVLDAADGREIVRLEREAIGGGIRRVTGAALQTKGDRPYVAGALAVEPGEVYTSPVELNQEFGRFQRPPVPVVRIAAPVRGAQGQITALVVLNVDLRPILTRIRTSVPLPQRVYLGTFRGDYALHPDPSREFGLDLGRPGRWREDFPEVADAVADSGIAFIREDSVGRVGIGAARFRLGEAEPLTLILTRPASVLLATSTTVSRSVLIGSAVMGTLAVLLGLLLSRSVTGPLRRLTEAVDSFRHSYEWTPPGNMTGELAVLSETFTHMADEVGEKTRRLEAEIVHREQTQAQLVRAQKLEAVGRFASGVAHDFNNLLTTILANAEILRIERASDGPDDIAGTSLEEIAQAGTRASELTRQLLAIGRRQVMEPQPLDLNAVVRSAERLLRRVIAADIRLVTVLDEELGTVMADPSQMEQVVLNLAVNARDAMPSGGRLTIRTSNVVLDEAYADEHFRVDAGSYVMMAVADTGEGMEEKTRAQLFDPFFSTKDPGKGTGLGLSIVQGIVSQTGGYVWVYSDLGRGTTFKTYLPRIDAPAEAVRSPHQWKSTGAVEGTERVLFIEDDDSVRKVGVRVLTRLGYRVLAAENGAEALRLGSGHGDEIEVIVSDVMLPDLTGPRLIERLRDYCPTVPVLFTSGYAADAIVERGDLPPDSSYLQKPYAITDLARSVRALLDQPG